MRLTSSIKYFIFILLGKCLLISCAESSPSNSIDSSLSCPSSNTDSLITLSGILHLNSSGDFVFEENNKGNWQRKTHLIPCTEDLGKYVISAYDSYLYLKNFDESFWIEIEGVYLDMDTEEVPPEFIFSFLSLIDEEVIQDSAY